MSNYVAHLNKNSKVDRIIIKLVEEGILKIEIVEVKGEKI